MPSRRPESSTTALLASGAVQLKHAVPAHDLRLRGQLGEQRFGRNARPQERAQRRDTAGQVARRRAEDGGQHRTAADDGERGGIEKGREHCAE